MRKQTATKTFDRYDRSLFYNIVGGYLDSQEFRKKVVNRMKASTRRDTLKINSEGYNFMLKQLDLIDGLEADFVKQMEQLASQDPLSRWAMSIPGIDAKFACLLRYFIDFERCCCPQYAHFKGKERRNIPKHTCPGLRTWGSIWSFGGQVSPKNPNCRKWEKGQTRPYSTRFKACLYLIGEGFKKLCPSEAKARMTDEELGEAIIQTRFVKKGKTPPSNGDLEILIAKSRKLQKKKIANLSDPAYLYCNLYLSRKKKEIEKDRNGHPEIVESARLLYESVKRNHAKVSKKVLETWRSGHLQAIGLDRRAMKYARMIFVSHYHEIGYRYTFGKPPPVPYAQAILGHSGYIPPPNNPFEELAEAGD